MKSVLISIKPKWCEKIASGEKTIEVRKSAPKEVPFKAYIYETQGATETPWVDEDGHFIYKGRGKVIGEFICNRVEKLEEHIEEGGLYYTLKSDFNEAAQLDNWELHDYGKGKTLYGWHISDLKIYDKPKELWQFYKCGAKTFEELSDGTELCEYCKFPSQGLYPCEGRFCDAAYEAYLDCNFTLTRPPQSWQYVEELKNV